MVKQNRSVFNFITWLLLVINGPLLDINTPNFYPPTLKWKFSAGAPFIASPVIHRDKIFIGSLDSTVYAIDKVTGSASWKMKFQGEIRSAVCIYKDQLAFVCGDGNIYMLRQDDGSTTWFFKTKGEKKYELYSYADYFYSSPVADGPNLYFGSGDGNVYCIDAETGKLRWSFNTAGVVHATPLVDGENLYIGSFDGYFYALDKRTGELKWKFKSIGHQYFPKGEFQGTPASNDKLVYIASRDYNFYALDKKQGSGFWNRKFELGWAMGVPKIHDSLLYVGTSDDKLLLAMNPIDGRIVWQTNLGFNIFGGSAFGGDLLYIGTLIGKLYGIDKRSGAIKWTWETDSYITNKRTYFNDDDSYRKDITSIIRKGEDFITMYYNLGAIFSTPVISNHHLFVSSTDGNLYCFKLTGESQ